MRHSLQDGNPADDTASLTLQPATAPLTPTPAPVTVLKPVIGRPKITPQAVAGKRVTVRFPVTRSDTRKPLRTGKMICDPSIKAKVLGHAERFKNGIARLTFTIPKNAKGKLLKVRLTIKVGTRSTTRIATYRIR
jgi:hypothetical protein